MNLEQINKNTGVLVKIAVKWALIAFIAYAAYLLIFTEDKFGVFIGKTTQKAVLLDQNTDSLAQVAKRLKEKAKPFTK